LFIGSYLRDNFKRHLAIVWWGCPSIKQEQTPPFKAPPISGPLTRIHLGKVGAKALKISILPTSLGLPLKKTQTKASS